MSLNVNTTIKVEDGSDISTLNRVTINDCKDLFSLSSGDYFTGYVEKSTLTGFEKVHPSESLYPFISIYPTPIDNHQFTNFDNTTYGTIRTYLDDTADPSNTESPYIESDYYTVDEEGSWDNRNPTIHYGGRMAFKFWNPTEKEYSQVILAYKRRNDTSATLVMPEIRSTTDPTIIVYDEKIVDFTDCFVNEQNLRRPTNQAYVFSEFADLMYENLNRWAFENQESVKFYYIPSSGVYLRQGNMSTRNIDEAIYATGRRLNSPFAHLIGNLAYATSSGEIYTYYYDCTQTPGRLYPILTNIHRNFDDPQERWCATLTFCVVGSPACSYSNGCPAYDYTTIRRVQQNIATQIGSSPIINRAQTTPVLSIPESYAPFGSWDILLDDTFELSETEYVTTPYGITEVTTISV
jgi:hypothetical protein